MRTYDAHLVALETDALALEQVVDHLLVRVNHLVLLRDFLPLQKALQLQTNLAPRQQTQLVELLLLLHLLLQNLTYDITFS